MPPLSGASGRFLVLRSYCAAQPDKWWVAALAALFSLAAAGSCLRFIISIYSSQEKAPSEEHYSFRALTKAITAVLIIVIAGAGLYPEAMRLALEAGSAVMALPPSP
jgi:NADH:ubiquinone oxidoreductase subunit 2 (subunit N)